MLKKFISAVLAAAMSLSAAPVLTASAAEGESESAAFYGFEEGEEDWIINSTDGRVSSGYDSYQKHSGERSYKFEAVTSTVQESEYASIAKIFDVTGSDAYKVGIYYLLSEDYTRLDGSTGGAVFTYTLLDNSGAEIPGAKYEYYIASKEYEAGEYDALWQGNDFYIIPTDNAAKCKITLGIKSATGQVNFDDVTIDKISKSEALSNPVTQVQIQDENIRDSYECGWEGDDINWWKTSISANAVRGNRSYKHGRSFRQQLLYVQGGYIERNSRKQPADNKQ